MLGAFMALRTGSGEAIQALFPVLFIFLMSSMNAPRNSWRSTGSGRSRPQPRLVPHRGSAASSSRAGTSKHCRSASRSRDRAHRDLHGRRVARAGKDGPHVSRGTWHAYRLPVRGLADDAQRADDAEHPHSVHCASALLLHGVRGRPPSCRGCRASTSGRRTAFQFVFVLLQSAAFGGVHGLRHRATSSRVRGG